MRSILEEKLDKYIKDEFVYDFNIPETGLYVIEITGRARSWLQNTLRFVSFLKDDDLAVKIDDKEFPKLNGKRGLFDSETAWNGNKLSGLQQTNMFLINLETGQHSLNFFADQLPLLETVIVYHSQNQKIITLNQFPKIEAGNRRPWLSVVLVNLSLEKLGIQASANKKQNRDENDLQLKINGQRQVNDIPKSHKYWYWCGRVLKGQSKTFDKKLNLAAGLHYIELWTDNTPVLEKVELTLAKSHDNLGSAINIITYTYRGVYGNEDYNRY